MAAACPLSGTSSGFEANYNHGSHGSSRMGRRQTSGSGPVDSVRNRDHTEYPIRVVESRQRPNWNPFPIREDPRDPWLNCLVVIGAMMTWNGSGLTTYPPAFT